MTSGLFSNIASAASIAAVIVTMSVLGNPALKALVYSLPLPLSIALLATGGHVGGSNVLGLGLLVGFLWLVRLLYARTGSIAWADLVGAGAYLSLGWLLTSRLHPGFAVSATGFGVGWSAFAVLHRPAPVTATTPSPVDVRAKGAAVFGLSLLLLSARSPFAGTVVTFPFSGVFAVVEGRQSLDQLAAVFTRNSVAMLALLCVVRQLQAAVSLWPALLLGWVAYAVVLSVLRSVHRPTPADR